MRRTLTAVLLLLLTLTGCAVAPAAAGSDKRMPARTCWKAPGVHRGGGRGLIHLLEVWPGIPNYPSWTKALPASVGFEGEDGAGVRHAGAHGAECPFSRCRRAGRDGGHQRPLGHARRRSSRLDRCHRDRRASAASAPCSGSSRGGSRTPRDRVGMRRCRVSRRHAAGLSWIPGWMSVPPATSGSIHPSRSTEFIRPRLRPTLQPPASPRLPRACSKVADRSHLPRRPCYRVGGGFSGNQSS